MSSELAQRVEAIRREEATIHEGGGAKAIARQHEKGRLTARERMARLLDPAEFLSPAGIRSLSKFHLEHPFHFGDVSLKR